MLLEQGFDKLLVPCPSRPRHLAGCSRIDEIGLPSTIFPGAASSCEHDVYAPTGLYYFLIHLTGRAELEHRRDRRKPLPWPPLWRAAFPPPPAASVLLRHVARRAAVEMVSQLPQTIGGAIQAIDKYTDAQRPGSRRSQSQDGQIEKREV
jgi:hypothetical protein